MEGAEEVNRTDVEGELRAGSLGNGIHFNVTVSTCIVQSLDRRAHVLAGDHVADFEGKTLKVGFGRWARKTQAADPSPIVLLLPKRERREQQEEYQTPHRHSWLDAAESAGFKSVIDSGDGPAAADRPSIGLSGFSDSAGSDAVGANSHPFVGFAIDNPNPLKIRIPPTLRQIMSVTHTMPIDRTFVTDFATLRHASKTPLNIDFEV